MTDFLLGSFYALYLGALFYCPVSKWFKVRKMNRESKVIWQSHIPVMRSIPLSKADKRGWHTDRDGNIVPASSLYTWLSTPKLYPNGSSFAPWENILFGGLSILTIAGCIAGMAWGAQELSNIIALIKQ